ncbi:SDR family oxidoreductase [Echinicola salinicaeni]|uniref:SDR family oxidoreductase n=1 Tax=Echinicola salinicaeni TaxID=2762757 RepID=UPI001644B2BC|nr:SDR family NAD(P)-dependent oxidoreductase [Echinicola salinicaeni]
MQLHNNTIFITGGSSGIGLELAKRFIEKGNKVLVCGRSKVKLDKAKQMLPELVVYQCDISVKKECRRLFQRISVEYPDCNVLINNAAIVHRTNFHEDEDMVNKAELEIATNLIAPIVLTKLFLPLLLKNSGSYIINISSGLVYSPKAAYPIYNSTKAGLHSFSQTMRMQCEHSSLSLVEVFMPVVDTPWHSGNVPQMAISVDQAVRKMLKGLEKGQMEIKVGKVKMLYWLHRFFPSLASKVIN